jgi:hypothetical protein
VQDVNLKTSGKAALRNKRNDDLFKKNVPPINHFWILAVMV